MCSLKYCHHLQQCLPHSRQSVDTVELIDKLSPQPRKGDCYYSVQKLTISLSCTKSWKTGKQPSWDSKTPGLPLREESKEEELLLYNRLCWTLSDHTPHQQPRPAAGEAGFSAESQLPSLTFSLWNVFQWLKMQNKKWQIIETKGTFQIVSAKISHFRLKKKSHPQHTQNEMGSTSG